jgi:hypothetical protein
LSGRNDYYALPLRREKIQPLDYYKNEMKKPSQQMTLMLMRAWAQAHLQAAKRVDYTTTLGINNLIIRI